MKRMLTLAVVVMLACGSVLAETDYKALRVINDIQRGKNNKNQIVDLRVQNDATIGGDLTVAGDIALTGDAEVDNLDVLDSLDVRTNTVVRNNLTVSNDLTVVGDASAEDIAAGGNLDVVSNAIIAGVLTVTGDVTGVATIGGADITATDDIEAGDDLIVGGDMSVTGNVTILGLEQNIRGSIIWNAYDATVTNGQELAAIWPTYIIDAAGPVTCTVANAQDKGHDVVIINDGAQQIHFLGTGNLHLQSGTNILTQYDAMHLRAAATDSWIQVGTISDNS